MYVDSESDEYFYYYKVQNDMTLFKLAKMKNVNPTLLSAINNLDEEDFVFTDQLIMIPKNNYAFYITKSGDTIDGLAQIFNSSRNDILRDNKTIYLHEGQLIAHKIK